jgi:small subunit ribosomal protein S17
MAADQPEEKGQQPADPEAEAPAEQPEAEEAPAEQQEEEAPGEEEAADAPAEEPEPGEGEEPAPADAAEEPAPAAGDEPPEAEELTPKQRRRLERSRASGPPGPQRSPAERAAERAERRRGAAAQRRRHRLRRREKRGDPRQGTPRAERRPAGRKVRQGRVVSTAAEKTITVRLEIMRRHPTYEKVVRRSSTVHAHDERGEANEGDLVRVVETRPLSRTKRWRLVEILERAR